jgi:hypothetical protein
MATIMQATQRETITAWNRAPENKAPRGIDDTNWRCSYCMKWHPVATMARLCEAKHERELR